MTINTVLWPHSSSKNLRKKFSKDLHCDSGPSHRLRGHQAASAGPYAHSHGHRASGPCRARVLSLLLQRVFLWFPAKFMNLKGTLLRSLPCRQWPDTEDPESSLRIPSHRRGPAAWRRPRPSIVPASASHWHCAIRSLISIGRCAIKT